MRNYWMDAPEDTIGERNPSRNGKPKAERKPYDREPNDARPKLDAGNHDLAVITPEALRLLQAANDPPRLFGYGNLTSRLERDDHGTPIIKLLTQERVRHELAREILFTSWKKVGANYVEEAALPPREVCQDILATPALPFPVLRRIVECPVFAADGTLHTTPGYSPNSQTYYQPAAGTTQSTSWKRSIRRTCWATWKTPSNP